MTIWEWVNSPNGQQVRSLFHSGGVLALSIAVIFNTRTILRLIRQNSYLLIRVDSLENQLKVKAAEAKLEAFRGGKR